MNHKTLLKSFAATTSLLCALTCSIQTAEAAATSNVFATGDIEAVTAPNFASGNALKYTGVFNVAVGGGGPATVLAVDLNGHNGQLNATTNNLILGSVSDLTLGATFLDITVSPGLNLTLNGTGGLGVAAFTYDRLGVVTLNGGTIAIQSGNANLSSASLRFTSGATFARDLAPDVSKLGRVNLGGASTYAFNGGNIYASSVTATDGATFTLASDTILSNLTANNLTLNAGNNTLTLQNGGALTGDSTLNITLTPATHQSVGYIDITNGALDLSGITKFTLSITEPTDIGSTDKFVIISGSNNYKGTPIIVSNNTAHEWSYGPDANGNGVLSAANIGATKKSVIESNPDAAQYLDNLPLDSEVAQLIINADPEKRAAILAQLGVNGVTATNINKQSMDRIIDTVLPSILQEVYARYIDPISVSSATNETNIRDEGIAAGDAPKQPHGMWASGSAFGGVSRQGRIKGGSGYKTKTYGSSMGLDTMFNEHWMGGIAFTYVESHTAMRNLAIGTSFASKTSMVTMYGLYNINNKWSVRGSMSYGNSLNNSSSTRLVRLRDTKAVALSKYNSTLISPEVGINYRRPLGKTISFSANLGVQYRYTIDEPYRETGARPTNQYILKRPKAGLWSTSLGVGVGSMFKAGSAFIMPEIHTSFRRALQGKNPLVMVQFDGMPGFISVQSKPTRKVSYGVGGSVTLASSGGVSLGIGYDATLGEKFIGHNGSLRLRVTF